MKRLMLLAGIWGWSFLFIKVAVAGLTPSTVAALRVGLGAAVLLGFLRARGLRLPRGMGMVATFPRGGPRRQRRAVHAAGMG